MNTNSVPLTKQELRHGRFFGPFSQTCETLALEYNAFWETILSPRKIARMGDVQLVSSLIILQLDGIQNKSDAIDDFYSKYDETFADRAKNEIAFRHTMEQIDGAVGGIIRSTQFRRPAHLYTLYCAAYHRMFGIPDVKNPAPGAARKLSQVDKDRLKTAVIELSDIIITAARKYQTVPIAKKADKPNRRQVYPKRYQRFIAALSGTDAATPRRHRFETLYGEAFG